MALTSDEQKALTTIERELCRNDPVLGQRFTALTLDQRRCRVVWAHRMMIVGGLLTFFGLIASKGLISLGAIFCWYGLLILLIASYVAVQNRTRQNSPGRRRRRR